MRIALVIVDMQMGFINENTVGLVDKIEKFLGKHQDKFTEIIGTRYINDENTACYKFEHWKECMYDTKDVEFEPQLEKFMTAKFDKDKYSCWKGDFITYVKNKHIDKLYFIGVNTGCCVLHSVLDAYNDLQDCAVISSLCGSTNGDYSHRIALQVLDEIITKQRVISTTQFELEVG